MQPLWLLWRDMEESGYSGVFAQRPGSQNFQRLPVINQKSRHLKLMNLVLFYVWEGTKVWVHWNHSLDMNFELSEGSILCFSVLRVLKMASLGCTIEVGCSSWWLDGCNVLCSLIWQATFFPSQDMKLTIQPVVPIMNGVLHGPPNQEFGQVINHQVDMFLRAQGSCSLSLVFQCPSWYPSYFGASSSDLRNFLMTEENSLSCLRMDSF